jgi:hypothetical protein
MRTSRPFGLASSLVLLSTLSLACSDGSGSPDASTADASAEDATALPDATTPDSGFTRDTGVADAGPRDAGHYCAANERVTVNATMVTLTGAATETPVEPTGDRSELSCFTSRPDLMLFGQIRFRGCARVLGPKPTQAELDQLDIAVFRAATPQGQPVDPTVDPGTGLDRSPNLRIRPSVTAVANSTGCNGDVEIEIGRDSRGTEAVTTDTEYVLRIRGRLPSSPWAEIYDHGVIVRSDALERGANQVDRCNPQLCSGRIDLVLARKDALIATAQALRVTAPETKGHALALVSDCANVPIGNAVGGFSPSATVSYVTPRLQTSLETATSTIGGLLAMGFTNTSSRAAGAIAVGFGLTRDGTCTEAYAGRVGRVYPGALSVVRVGRENTLNRR